MAWTVLLVDDSSTIREVFRMALLKTDFDLQIAKTAAEGLELAKSVKPDVMLIDLRITDGGGYSLCESVKTDSQTSSIPVLLLAGANIERDENKAAEVLAEGFFTKPFYTQELLDQLSEFCDEQDENSETEELTLAAEVVEEVLVVEEELVVDEELAVDEVLAVDELLEPEEIELDDLDIVVDEDAEEIDADMILVDSVIDDFADDELEIPDLELAESDGESDGEFDGIEPDDIEITDDELLISTDSVVSDIDDEEQDLEALRATQFDPAPTSFASNEAEEVLEVEMPEIEIPEVDLTEEVVLDAALEEDIELPIEAAEAMLDMDVDELDKQELEEIIDDEEFEDIASDDFDVDIESDAPVQLSETEASMLLEELDDDDEEDDLLEEADLDEGIEIEDFGDLEIEPDESSDLDDLDDSDESPDSDEPAEFAESAEDSSFSIKELSDIERMRRMPLSDLDEEAMPIIEKDEEEPLIDVVGDEVSVEVDEEVSIEVVDEVSEEVTEELVIYIEADEIELGETEPDEIDLNEIELESATVEEDSTFEEPQSVQPSADEILALFRQAIREELADIYKPKQDALQKNQEKVIRDAVRQEVRIALAEREAEMAEDDSQMDQSEMLVAIRQAVRHEVSQLINDAIAKSFGNLESSIEKAVGRGLSIGEIKDVTAQIVGQEIAVAFDGMPKPIEPVVPPSVAEISATISETLNEPLSEIREQVASIPKHDRLGEEIHTWINTALSELPDLAEISTLIKSSSPEQSNSISSSDEIRQAIKEEFGAISKDTIEAVAWEIVPDLSEQIIKKELDRLTKENV